jgi:hypothetical protein
MSKSQSSSRMDHSAEYRIQAMEFLELAQGISQPTFREELINMAMSYARLADLAEQNGRTDVVHETPAARHAGPA